jgi:hypothetical protein
LVDTIEEFNTVFEGCSNGKNFNHAQATISFAAVYRQLGVLGGRCRISLTWVLIKESMLRITEMEVVVMLVA